MFLSLHQRHVRAAFSQFLISLALLQHRELTLHSEIGITASTIAFETYRKIKIKYHIVGIIAVCHNIIFSGYIHCFDD